METPPSSQPRRAPASDLAVQRNIGYNSRPAAKAPDAVLGRPFDPWNSVSLGHQRSDGASVRGWRESRTAKLGIQFRAGNCGGSGHASDSVGKGSEDIDDRLGMLAPKDVRARAARSVVDMLRHPGSMAVKSMSSSGLGLSAEEKQVSLSSSTTRRAPGAGQPKRTAASSHNVSQQLESESDKRNSDSSGISIGKAIFDGLVIYVNGSTHPLISDHKLKRVLAENGARIAIHLGRRQVTHVILGNSSSASSSLWTGGDGGCGGRLAAGKVEGEIRRAAGCGVKFVGVEWVLESVKAGRRLPEARFANVRVAWGRGVQRSVYGVFPKDEPGAGDSKERLVLEDGGAESTAAP